MRPPVNLLTAIDQEAEKRNLNRTAYFKYLHTEYVLNNGKRENLIKKEIKCI